MQLNWSLPGKVALHFDIVIYYTSKDTEALLTPCNSIEFRFRNTLLHTFIAGADEICKTTFFEGNLLGTFH